MMVVSLWKFGAHRRGPQVRAVAVIFLFGIVSACAQALTRPASLGDQKGSGDWYVERTVPDGTLSVVARRAAQRELLGVTCLPDDFYYLLINPNAVHVIRVEPLRDRPGLTDATLVQAEYRFDDGHATQTLFNIGAIQTGRGGYRIFLIDELAMTFIEGLQSARSSVDISLEGEPSFKFDITPEGRQLLSTYLSRPCPWR